MASSTTLCLGVLISLILFHKLHASSSFSLSVEKLNEDVIVSSPKPTFTAGFYAVGHNAFCFAIWYTNSPNTLVWIANRDHPVNGKRSTLSLLKSGNLVLTDAAQFQVWSTATATTSKQVHLRLHDSGNLVLLEDSSNNTVLWQSFDFPTDTLLPNQPLRGSTNLVSSRSGSNHSSGFYKLFFDFENVLRLIYQGPRVSSVFWPYAWLQSNNFGNGNGRSTFNDSRVALLDDLGAVLSSDNFTFRTIDYGTVLQRRLTLDHDGNVRVYTMIDGEEKWVVSGLFRQQPCFIHGICGPNSYCTNDPTIGRKCSCLPGHRWNNTQDWSQGCEPNFQSGCGNTPQESNFLTLPQTDFYGYDYGLYSNHTYQQCVDECLRLCECKGFQFNFPKQDGLGSHCYLKWQLLNGHRSADFDGAFFLRLPRDFDDIAIVRNGNGMVELRKNTDKEGYVVAVETGFRKFSYSELKQATKGFSDEIGRGGGGTVYKGVLTDNQVVAIKRLHEVANQGESEFLAEVSIIGRLNHMNLIGMLGYCAEGKHRLLVYEYMENGSLAHNLSSASNALDWRKRYNIAVGTARGVQFTELESESGHHERLVTWVREKKRKGPEVGPSWVDEIVDPALGSNYDMNEMEILATVALECVEEEKNVRPNMSQVAERLQNHDHDSR
ncbi:hypothetical protein ACSQ67_020925 [Phaseolus vulgaris]